MAMPEKSSTAVSVPPREKKPLDVASIQIIPAMSYSTALTAYQSDWFVSTIARTSKLSKKPFGGVSVSIPRSEWGGVKYAAGTHVVRVEASPNETIHELFATMVEGEHPVV